VIGAGSVAAPARAGCCAWLFGNQRKEKEKKSLCFSVCGDADLLDFFEIEETPAVGQGVQGHDADGRIVGVAKGQSEHWTFSLGLIGLVGRGAARRGTQQRGAGWHGCGSRAIVPTGARRGRQGFLLDFTAENAEGAERKKADDATLFHLLCALCVLRGEIHPSLAQLRKAPLATEGEMNKKKKNIGK
jgi:hypothetical protein